MTEPRGYIESVEHPGMVIVRREDYLNLLDELEHKDAEIERLNKSIISRPKWAKSKNGRAGIGEMLCKNCNGSGKIHYITR